MKNIGNSTLWCEKYRPTSIEDLIAPESTRKLLHQIITSGEVQNLLFFGSAGIGKTSAARALIKDLGGEELYINGSLETSIDVIRDRVVGFASTYSFLDGGQKVVVLDECERISPQGQDALKVVLEETSSNCRFIFCTNNLQKIISPLHSRCKLVSFNYTKSQAEEIMLQYFKRVCFVLKNEGFDVEKDTKGVLAEFVKMLYPDFRKILNELQGYVKQNGKVDLGLLKSTDTGYLGDLVSLLKDRSFSKMRKLCTEIDPDGFYRAFYDEISEYVKPEAIPEIVLILNEHQFKHCNCIDQEINLVACCTVLMQELNGKWK